MNCHILQGEIVTRRIAINVIGGARSVHLASQRPMSGRADFAAAFASPGRRGAARDGRQVREYVPIGRRRTWASESFRTAYPYTLALRSTQSRRGCRYGWCGISFRHEMSNEEACIVADRQQRAVQRHRGNNRRFKGMHKVDRSLRRRHHNCPLTGAATSSATRLVPIPASKSGPDPGEVPPAFRRNR